jgi:hypothetical protein
MSLPPSSGAATVTGLSLGKAKAPISLPATYRAGRVRYARGGCSRTLYWLALALPFIGMIIHAEQRDAKQL